MNERATKSQESKSKTEQELRMRNNRMILLAFVWETAITENVLEISYVLKMKFEFE